jgi:hypothetical protein
MDSPAIRRTDRAFLRAPQAGHQESRRDGALIAAFWMKTERNHGITRIDETG